MIKYLPLKHPLPPRFSSWTQVLTDWGVIESFKKTEPPRCLASNPALAVPLVAEISAILCLNRLSRHATPLALHCQHVTEPAYNSAGGQQYRDIHAAMEAAQERWVHFRREATRAGNPPSPETHPLHVEMRRLQSEFLALRRRHESHVQQARSSAARVYWSNSGPCEIPDTFFADLPRDSFASRISRIHPPWWGLFLSNLQKTFSRRHPAKGLLLDELPQLRAAAKRKTYAALIDEWREAHADRFGWYDREHHRVLLDRTADKATVVTDWFLDRAPGYFDDPTVRQTLQDSLAQRLAQLDPWVDPESSDLSAHWRN